LTAGTKPSAETLLKLSLHATELAAVRIQGRTLDGIGCRANDQPVQQCASRAPPVQHLKVLLQLAVLLIIMTQLQIIIDQMIVISTMTRRKKSLAAAMAEATFCQP
jgi:hypothetical protein